MSQMVTLTEPMIELLSAGVAHQIGACDASGRPCICRALAARAEADGRVVVLLSGESGHEVLDAIRATGRVSAVFALPQTFRTLHVKGNDAQVGSGEAYRALLDERHRAFHAQLVPYGFPLAFTTAWYTVPDDDLMAIHFTPCGAWDQTPGPGAGSALELRR